MRIVKCSAIGLISVGILMMALGITIQFVIEPFVVSQVCFLSPSLPFHHTHCR